MEQMGTHLLGGSSIIPDDGNMEETPLKHVNPDIRNSQPEGRNIEAELEEEVSVRETHTESSYPSQDDRNRSTAPEELSGMEAYKVLERFANLEQQNLELTKLLKVVIAQQVTTSQNRSVAPTPDNTTNAEMLQAFRPLVEAGAEERVIRQPLAREIFAEQLPVGLVPANLEKYMGTGDPDDRLQTFQIAMQMQGASDATLCKAFPTTLGGSAREWYMNLPEGIIHTWDGFARIFLAKYEGRRHRKVPVQLLVRLRQQPEESLKDFFYRWTNIVQSVRNVTLDIATASMIQATHNKRLKEALKSEVRKYEEHAMMTQARKGEGGGERIDRMRKENIETKEGAMRGENTVPSMSKIFLYMQHKDPHIQWPEPLRGDPDHRNHRKFCEIHNSHGHTTEECR
ncbi:hypothetical protein LINPERPRIM_LOCUS30327 [Linum perenne]